MPRYCEPWLGLGAAAVTVVAPPLDADALAAIADCTGIFIAGGDTRRYHDVYGAPAVAAQIQARVRAGIPCAGLSAGALLLPDVCLRWGDRWTTPSHA